MANPEPLRLDPDAVLWSAAPESHTGRPLLVLLHGFGVDERDLFGLAPYLPPDFVLAAARAPLAAPWPAQGYAWYPIEELTDATSDGVTAAASALLSWLDRTVNPESRVGLLGFSQGAAVSLQALREAPERISFAVVLSGYAAEGPRPGDDALAARRPPVFWGRGTDDAVIPAPLVDHTQEWLPGHVDLTARVYSGMGHGVSEVELADVNAFLNEQLRFPRS